jgi:hypothetical protein
MKPTTPQQAAHLRLSSALPVRTHRRPESHYRANVHFMAPIKYVERKKRIRALRHEGKTPREIARIEDVSICTVYNHLRNR